MDSVVRKRAKNFISQSIQRTKETSQETENTLTTMSQLFAQYSSVIADVLTAKSKYISIVEKYLDKDDKIISVTDYFPGLKSKSPLKSLSSSEMLADTKQMQLMANLVKDLERQKENLEDQLERTFKKAANNIHQIESLAAQSSSYLDDMISEIGEIYGNIDMNQLIQKNSL